MARRRTLIAALLLAVLLGHALVLQWLSWQVLTPSVLKPMAAPMLTRLLQPAAPVAQSRPVVAPAVKPRRPRDTAAIQSVAAAKPPDSPASVVPPVPPQASEPAVADPAKPADPVAATAEPAPDPAPPGEAPTPPADASLTAAINEALNRWPVDTRLNYRLSGNFRGELHGNARVEWLRQGERYQTRIDIDLGVVSVVMTSQGGISWHGLTPFLYEESRAGKRRSARLQDNIVLHDGRQLPRPEGVQDTASQFVDLSHRFATGQLPLEVGRSVSFWMARPGGVDFWTYDVTDKEMLQTPALGLIEAFHLKPRPIENARGNIMAEMWFAPSLQYLPVRIRVTAGEANLDLIVEKIEQR